MKPYVGLKFRYAGIGTPYTISDIKDDYVVITWPKNSEGVTYGVKLVSHNLTTGVWVPYIDRKTILTAIKKYNDANP